MTHDGVRCGVAVYPDVAVFNHSCQANATLISVPDDGAEDNEDEEQVADNWPKELLGVKCMVALCDIAEGDEINICYVHPKVRFAEAFWRFVRLLAQLHTRARVQAPTEERRSQLWKNWFFWCQCPSCSDPSNYEAYGLLLSPLAIATVLCPSAAELRDVRRVRVWVTASAMPCATFARGRGVAVTGTPPHAAVTTGLRWGDCGRKQAPCRRRCRRSAS